MADTFGSKPQFNTAEYKSQGDACNFCNAPISTGSGYYRLNGKTACSSCAQRIQTAMPSDGHANFVRATLFGAAAAVVGMGLYAGVETVTHFTIGYMALAVGFIVAKAMMQGSGGFGGRRYQVVAVALTYFAISMAAIVVALAETSAQIDYVKAAPRLLYYGLASPFLELQESTANGLIGVVILFVGLQIAWRLAAGRGRVTVEGPY